MNSNNPLAAELKSENDSDEEYSEKFYCILIAEAGSATGSNEYTIRNFAMNALERVVGLLALAATVVFVAPSSAQQPTDEQRNAIRSACRSDYEANCASVPPGGGFAAVPAEKYVKAFRCLQAGGECHGAGARCHAES
jgi:hypothetical protein